MTQKLDDSEQLLHGVFVKVTSVFLLIFPSFVVLSIFVRLMKSHHFYHTIFPFMWPVWGDKKHPSMLRALPFFKILKKMINPALCLSDLHWTHRQIRSCG